MISIVKTTRLKDDSALGLVLSVFFGFGLVLLTFIQRMPNAAQAGLDKFLFGQAATLLASDVITMAVLGLIVLAFVALFWKEFKLLSFDPAFGASLGFPMRLLDVVLTTLLVVAIVIGLADRRRGADERDDRRAGRGGPAVDRPARAHGRAGGRSSAPSPGVSGAVISSSTAHLPTGPTIVLCVSVLVLISLFFAPNRGWSWRWARQRRNTPPADRLRARRPLQRWPTQHERVHTRPPRRGAARDECRARRRRRSLHEARPLAAGCSTSARTIVWALTPKRPYEAAKRPGICA